MQYLYHSEAGLPWLELSGDEHHYLFRVRRHKDGDIIYLRNLRDQMLCRYHIDRIDKKSAVLVLEEQKEHRVEARLRLHLGWCMIDPKTIEKSLPSLNEMGVAKITFIYCQRSQKDFKTDFKRLEKILLNSSQQCGRSVLMELAEAKSLTQFLGENPGSRLLNFSENRLDDKACIETLVIGAEGGFNKDECSLFGEEMVVGLDTSLILKSESAACAVAGKLLL